MFNKKCAPAGIRTRVPTSKVWNDSLSSIIDLTTKPDYTTGAFDLKMNVPFKKLLLNADLVCETKILYKTDKVKIKMGQIILGLTEEVTISGGSGKEKKVKARIDTGATASSIDSSLAQELELDSTEKFKMVRSASGTKKRQVVIAKIKMDGLAIEEEFTLADRNRMTYPLLIGQNILKKGDFLINPKKR